MKTVLIILCAIIALVFGATIPEDAKATIIEYDSTTDGQGNYGFSFLTSNGIQRSETGQLVNIGQPDEHIEVQGEVSYTGPDGNRVILYYTAGEKGYQVMTPPLVLTPLAGVSPNVVASLLG